MYKVTDTKFSLLPLRDVHVHDWLDLVKRSTSLNSYATPRLMLSAESAWPKLNDMQAILGQVNNKTHQSDLVFLLPIIMRDQSLGQIMEIAAPPTADHIEPLVDNQYVQQATDGFIRFVGHELKPNAIVGEFLSESFKDVLCQNFGQSLAKQEKTGKGRYWRLPPNNTELLASFSSNFRQQVRRFNRKSVDAGISYKVSSGPDAMENLRTLHHLRFRSLGKKSFFLRSEFRLFHDEVVKADALSLAAPLFLEAHFEGRVIGSLYGVHNHYCFTYLMIGFDPDFARFNLGHQLIYETAKHLTELGVEVFDFKCGEESYKERWAKDQYCNYGLAFTDGIGGSVSYWLDQITKRVAN